MTPTTFETRLITAGATGRSYWRPVALGCDKGRIEFYSVAAGQIEEWSPFALKDEIKAMKGSHWHGNDRQPRPVWSIEDCPRNRFQLDYLQGKPVYEHFDRPIEAHGVKAFCSALEPHQVDLADVSLTRHYQILAAEMGVGKTLAAQVVIEAANVPHWFWVGPRLSLPNIAREFRKWGFDPATAGVEMLTYDGLVKRAKEWKAGDPVPHGLICDESSRLKSFAADRSRAAQFFADLIRQRYGLAGYVLLMSGTPSPASPVDWWSQAEIAWPGFLREGSPKALESRLAFMVNGQSEAGIYRKRVGWKDDAGKCAICGQYFDLGPHDEADALDADYHAFVKSVNEVAYLYERLKGLVTIKHKKDCLTLPDKRYRIIACEPSPAVLRVAKAIVETSPSTMGGLTLLRELSDGFQYTDAVDGVKRCKHCNATGRVDEWFDPAGELTTYPVVDMLAPEFVARLVKRAVDCPVCNGTGDAPREVRQTRQVPCPKEAALVELLDECEETGRIVIFAGFTGAVDRITALCRREGWAVVRCDGRGYAVLADGPVEEAPLDYWANLANRRVAFVAQAESGGQSLTLVESRMAVFWSNSFKPEYRAQAEDRIHRKGMDVNRGCTIVDLIHLPSDQRVLDVIRANRRLELMTMGEFAVCV